MSANANVQPNVPSQQPTPNIFNQRTENPTDMAGKKTIHSDVSAYVTQEIIENHRRDLNSSNSNRRIPVSLGDLQQQQQPIPLQDDDRHSVDSDSPDESACFIGADGDMMRRHHGYELEEAAQLEKLEIFAKEFKQKRIKMGFTQGDVGLAMGRLYGNDFSQTTISRFEALNLSFKNMCKLKPMLERWLRDTNTVLNEAKDGRPMIMPQIDTQFPSGRKRKKRTSIDQKKRSTLDVIFSRNPKPNSEDLHNIAEECSLDKEVVRVWFCNRRQKEKRIAMHEQQSNEGSMSSPDSPTHCHPQQTQPQQPSFHNNPAFTFQTNSSFSPMNPSREVPNQVTDRSKHLGMSPMGPNKGRHYAGQMLTQLGPEKKMIELPELHRNQQNQQNRAGAAQSRLTEDGVPASLAFPSPFFLSAAAAANARDVVKAVSAISMQQQHQQQQQQQQHQQPSFITSSSSSAEIPLTHSTISSCSSSFLPSSAPPQARYLCSSVSSMLPPPPTMPAVVPMTTGFQTTTGAAGIPLQLVHSNGVTSAASPVTQQRAASALHLK